MSYRLGIDLGTTYSAAAIARDGRARIVPLGNRTAAVPSMVHIAGSEVLVGDAAHGRAVSDPRRTAREFKRRMGDPSPILTQDRPWRAEELTALLAADIVRVVEASEGGPAEELVVTFPAQRGDAKRQLVIDALGAVHTLRLPPTRTITEPEAAAIHYAVTERIDPGQVVAVYDLGGGTFDAALLRREPSTTDGTPTFSLIGQPEGIDRLGGIDFDSAIYAHVNRFLGGALDRLDADEEAVMSALAQLRADCVEAQQTLSADTDVTIPVVVPGVASTQVRITRHEFESMIRPALTDTIGALRRALRSAEVGPDEIAAVLLVGGSSRIPLVAQMVGAELGRPVAIDAHPKHAVSLGAALSTPAPDMTTTTSVAVDTSSTAISAPPAPRPAAEIPMQRRSRRPVVIGAVVLTLAAIVAIIAATRQGGSSGSVATTATTTATTAATAGTPTTPTTAAPTSAPTSTPTTAASAPQTITSIPIVTSPALAAQCNALGPVVVCLTGIGVDAGGNLVAPYTTKGFEPLISGPPNRHVHFFFKVDEIAADITNAGSAGPDSRGNWILWDGPNPFGPGGSIRGYSVTQAQAAKATELCVLVADSNHVVAQGTGNCLPLPPSIVAG